MFKKFVLVVLIIAFPILIFIDLDSFLHPLNAPPPSSRKLSGKLIVSNEVHLLNAPLSISVKFFGKLMPVSEMQL